MCRLQCVGFKVRWSAPSFLPLKLDMFNQLASQSTRFFSDRTVRFGSFFLLALGCGIFGQPILSEISPSNAVGSLNLNGGMFEFMRSGNLAERIEWSPTIVACILFLVGIVGFLLQPLYLRPRSKSHSSPSKPSPSKPSPSERVRSKQVLSTQSASASEFYPSVALPLIDRLVITPQSIVASTCRSVDAVPEIEFVSRTIESFNHLLVQSNADIIVLTRSEITLEASEIILGIQRLQDGNFDVITPQRSSIKSSVNASMGDQSTQNSDSSSLSSSPALHHFICDVFGLHQAELTSVSQTQHQTDTNTSPYCYIVRREALLSILSLSQWSSSDVLTDIQVTPLSEAVTPHSKALTRV